MPGSKDSRLRETLALHQKVMHELTNLLTLTIRDCGAPKHKRNFFEVLEPEVHGPCKCTTVLIRLSRPIAAAFAEPTNSPWAQMWRIIHIDRQLDVKK